MKKAFYTAVAAFSLVAAPTMAAAAPIATPLTQPASEKVAGDNTLSGGGGFVVVGLAIVFIGLGIYIAVRNGNHDRPNSP